MASDENVNLTLDDTNPIQLTVERVEKPNDDKIENKELFNLINEMKSEISALKRQREDDIKTGQTKKRKLQSLATEKHHNKKDKVLIETSPVRERTGSTPPVRNKKEHDALNQNKKFKKQKIEVDSSNVISPQMCEYDDEGEISSVVDESDNDDTFNPYASQTDGYSDDDFVEHEEEDNVDENSKNKKLLDFSKISAVPTEEQKTEPINDEFAKVLVSNWQSKKPFENMKKIFKKYPCPENCVCDPPEVNLELWKLLNSAQRKADVKLVGVQKSLKKALNIGLSIFDEINSKDLKNSGQAVAQKTADMAAILGHASREISIKRRTFIRGVIHPQYKDLCSTTQPITKKLFGDDLPKLVKGLNLTNKIGKYRPRQKPYDRYQRVQMSNTLHKNPFLGQGRGNLPYRRYNNNNNNNNNKYYNKKKN